MGQLALRPWPTILHLLAFPIHTASITRGANRATPCRYVKLREHVTPLVQSSGAPSTHYRTIAPSSGKRHGAMASHLPHLSKYVGFKRGPYESRLDFKFRVYSFFHRNTRLCGERGTLTRTRSKVVCPVLFWLFIRSTVHLRGSYNVKHADKMKH